MNADERSYDQSLPDRPPMPRYGAQAEGRTRTPTSPLPATSASISVYLCYLQGVMAEVALSYYRPARNWNVMSP